MLIFVVLKTDQIIPDTGINTVYLLIDYWNDFRFTTMFSVTAFDENGVRHELKGVKIGFVGQTEAQSTYDTLTTQFAALPPGYFSAGMDVSYYVKLRQNASPAFRESFLAGLRDVVSNDEILSTALNERVFKISHLRTLSIVALRDQFRRVLSGGAETTRFNFRFVGEGNKDHPDYKLNFVVEPEAKPATNIHALIGRNGVGKTTLLNAMTLALDPTRSSELDLFGHFETKDPFEYSPIEKDFFSRVVLVSFSAFDPFDPPLEQTDPSKGTCVFYLGLKRRTEAGAVVLAPPDQLQDDFVESLRLCLSEGERRERWVKAMETLAIDDAIADMDLGSLAELAAEDMDLLSVKARGTIETMSSGHAIVLLTITRLIALVEEKSLVLFDEPESHLHPPLLSALIRCLSEILLDRNAVAIVATHSPVVLQEVPKSCVWKITRLSQVRLGIETFGENVGVLTREVFGLDVAKANFAALLAEEVDRGASFEGVMTLFKSKVGFEGQGILRSLLHNRDRS